MSFTAIDQALRDQAIVEQKFSVEAKRALAFARQHDWGRGAYLIHDGKGERVVGLEDWEAYVRPDGSTGSRMKLASTCATISALREFGLY